MSAILLYCRAGFERECAQEVTALAQSRGIEGFVKAKPQSGFAAFASRDPEAGARLGSAVDLADLIFARQVVRDATLLQGLPTGDRAGALAEQARAFGTRFQGLVLESPDTNDGKALAALIKPLTPHLRRALAKRDIDCEDGAAPDRLHFFFVGSSAAYVGRADAGRSSPWPMGIPRLKLPRAAPSRSTLKLAEAFLAFLGPGGIERDLRPGMTAVDLGSSPGGWTWQLARHGLSVIAVDNGPMDAGVLDSGLVRHVRADGFRFRPESPVDWMTCDIVESPSRVATLAAQWMAEGLCRRCIFNLKLPMKKRWEEVRRCAGIVHEALAGRRHALRIRQLYHDREEVTAFLAAPGQSR